MNTPTGPFAADTDGGCHDGQAARFVRVNARRLGVSIHRAKFVNVVGGGLHSLPHPTHDADRARTIPRPFAAPFKLMPFHDCEVARD